MNKFHIGVLSFMLTFSVGAKPLSEHAYIALLTCGSGDDLYSVFGHSALRLYDPANNIDVVFNYGTFDFQDPYFYMKFARGKLDYQLSVSTYEDFRWGYIYEKRYIFEQILNLSRDDVQRLADALWLNYTPENRNYRYDFFYDNCSTRIRDMLKSILGDRLRFDESLEPGQSFRQRIDDYVFNHPWGDFGIDVALGVPTDRKVNYIHHMFLPEAMRDAFEAAVVMQGNTEIPLVRESTTLLEMPLRVNVFQWGTPAQLFWAVLIVVLVGMQRGWKWMQHDRFNGVLFTVIGLVGLMVLLLWIATDHTATKGNWNLLWASPFYLLFPFLKRREKVMMVFLRVHVVMLVFAMLGWFILPQQLHWAVWPLMLLMLARQLQWYRRLA